MPSCLPNSHTISFHVTNLSAQDAQFLSQVIAMFTDPNLEPRGAAVRRASHCITYGPRGQAQLSVNPHSAIRIPQS